MWDGAVGWWLWNNAGWDSWWWAVWSTWADWLDWLLWLLWALWAWADWLLWLSWVGWLWAVWATWANWGWGLSWALGDGDGNHWWLWDQGGWDNWSSWVWGWWVDVGAVGWDWEDGGGLLAEWAVSLLWWAGSDGVDDGGVLGLVSWLLGDLWSWVGGHGDNGGGSWAVGDGLRAAGDGNLLSDVDGSGRDGGSQNGKGGNGELHFD